MASTVSLVLGSGGARGYAHIGVIEELLARGYTIGAVAGCSMGALIGGLYAAGALDDYKQWVNTLNYLDIVRLLDLSFRTPGAIGGDRIFDVIEGMVGATNIEELTIPYTAVATDLDSAKEIWFQSGPLLQAMRASVAIPSLFAPVNYNGRTLVDGGLLNPLPIAPMVAHHCDLIIAVDLNVDIPPSQLSCPVPPAASRQDRVFQRWINLLRNRTSRYTRDSSKAGEKAVKSGMIDIFNQSLEVMQESLARYKTAGYPPDLLVPISRNQCRFYEFNRAEEMISIGRLATERSLNEYEGQRG